MNPRSRIRQRAHLQWSAYLAGAEPRLGHTALGTVRKALTGGTPTVLPGPASRRLSARARRSALRAAVLRSSTLPLVVREASSAPHGGWRGANEVPSRLLPSGA